MMKRFSLIIVVFFLLAPGEAFSQQRSNTDAQLLRARDRFEYGDYADAVRILRRLIDDGRLVSEQQMVKAHRLLGVSLFYSGDEDESRAAFVRLLSIEPDFRLDPFFYPPRLVEFFDAVRSDNEALLAPLREQRKQLEKQRRLEEDARRRLLEEEDRRRALRRQPIDDEAEVVLEKIITNNTYLINWMPLGAGQFQNEEPNKAVGLAIAQVVAGAASVLGFAVVTTSPRCIDYELPQGSIGERAQTERKCGVPPDSINLVRNMERVKWISGSLFWGLVGYGIIDAHFNYQPQRVISETRIRSPIPGVDDDTVSSDHRPLFHGPHTTPIRLESAQYSGSATQSDDTYVYDCPDDSINCLDIQAENDSSSIDYSYKATNTNYANPSVGVALTIIPWLSREGGGALLHFHF